MHFTKKSYFFWFILFTLLLLANVQVAAQKVEKPKPLIEILRFNESKQIKLKNDWSYRNLSETLPTHFQTFLSDRNGAPLLVTLTETRISKYRIKNRLSFNGKIEGQNQSLVTLTISNGHIKGLISDVVGNYTFQSHNDQTLTINKTINKKAQQTWTCHSNFDKKELIDKPSFNRKSNNESDTIEIYVVCDYDLFELHGFSTSATENYVYNLFHQVQALYANENINIVISEIKIWETQDPYSDQTPEEALLSFKNDVGTDYNGDLAHLLSASSQLSGGVAFLNGICDRNKSYGYSNVDVFIDENAGYSWDVHVLSHELGHNLGSPHTHDCAWGPEGTDAIDACGAPDEACEDAPIPQEGGTIMSYCHSTNVGVNFSLGFGQEPGDRMRETINLCKSKLGETCDKAIKLFSSGSYDAEEIVAGFGATDPTASHAAWYSFVAPEDGLISIGSCGENKDTRLFIYSGPCSDLTLISESDDDCQSGGGYNYASQIIDLPIDSGFQILIEWDDRWNGESFNFNFDFISLNELQCSNGIQDGDETDIDCGGSCIPCQEPCISIDIIPAQIDTSAVYNTNNTSTYAGRIINQAVATISAPDGFEFKPGFEIKQQAQLEVILSDCQQ